MALLKTYSLRGNPRMIMKKRWGRPLSVVLHEPELDLGCLIPVINPRKNYILGRLKGYLYAIGVHAGVFYYFPVGHAADPSRLDLTNRRIYRSSRIYQAGTAEEGEGRVHPELWL